MTPTSNLIARSHDATLVAIHLDWSSGDVRLELSAVIDGSASSRVTLHASEVSFLHCPHRAPWGWSASINEVRTSSTHAGRVRLKVEVQSGDVIEAEAGAVTVEVVD